jgi:hypothetical protein
MGVAFCGAMTRTALRIAIGIAVLLGARDAQAFTITRTSSPIFYIDSGSNPQLLANYAA